HMNPCRIKLSLIVVAVDESHDDAVPPRLATPHRPPRLPPAIVSTCTIGLPSSALLSNALGIFSRMANVRFGSKADISRCNRHVRFTPKSGHRLDLVALRRRIAIQTFSMRSCFVLRANN